MGPLIDQWTIRASLKSRGLTQEWLAKKIGASYATLNGKLNGHKRWWLFEILIVVKVLEFDGIEDLLIDDWRGEV